MQDAYYTVYNAIDHSQTLAEYARYNKQRLRACVILFRLRDRAAPSTVGTAEVWAACRH
jgi:hypothetical protein